MGDHKNYIVMNYNRSLILSLDKNLIIVNGPTREQTVMDIIQYTTKIVGVQKLQIANNFKIFQHIFGIRLHKFITTYMKNNNIKIIVWEGGWANTCKGC